MADEEEDEDERESGEASLPDGFVPWQQSPVTAQARVASALPEGFVPWQPAAASRTQAQSLPEGFVPWQGDKQEQPETEAEGTFGHIARTVAHNILPGLAGVAGGVFGAAGGLPGAIAGGVGGYMGGQALQEKALNLMGFDDSQQQAVNAKTNPKTQIAAEVLSAAPFFGVGAAPKIVRAGGAAIGTALEGFNQYQQGELDPLRLGAAAGAGAILTRPRGLTQTLEREVGALAGRATGRPDLWPHGSAGAEAAAGTAEEQAPPPSDPAKQQPGVDDRYAKEPSAEPSAAEPPVNQSPPEQDPAMVKALRGEPIDEPLETQPPTTEAPEAAAVPPEPAPEPRVTPTEEPTPMAPNAEAQARPLLRDEPPPEPGSPAPESRTAAADRSSDDVLRGPEPGPAAAPIDKNDFIAALVKGPEATAEFARARGMTDEQVKASIFEHGDSQATSQQRYDRYLESKEAPPQPPAPEPPAKFSIAKDDDTGRHVLFRNDEEVADFKNRGEAEKARTKAVRLERIREAAARANQIAEEPDQALRRQEIVRGRDGRPIQTGALPIGTERAILRAGETLATGREPPLKAGMKRLYRGDTSLPPEQRGPIPDWIKDTPEFQKTVDATGRWFTPDRANAEYYNKHFGDGSGRISYVDIPAADAERYSVRNQPDAAHFTAAGREHEEHFVPREVADRTMPLTPGRAPPLRQAMARQGPGSGSAGQPPKPPKQQLIEEGKVGDAEAFKRAQEADSELNKLSTVPAADRIAFMQRLDEAIKMHPGIKGNAGEQIYNAIVNGTYDKLPEKMRKAYEHVTKDMLDVTSEIRKNLVARGILEHEADDPRYMKRLLKTAPDRMIADPINEGALPGMREPSSTKELAFYGAEAKDGERLVLSGKGDNIAVMKNGQKEGAITNPNEEGPKTGDKLTYKGKEFIVDRGKEPEIEQHARLKDGTQVEYHKNAFASAFMEHREMKMMKDYHDWLDRFKNPETSAFKDMMTRPTTPRETRAARERGWVQSEVPDLRGVYMHPSLEQVLHNNYNPGMGLPDIDWARVVNQMGVRSIFWNPVPHAMNAFMHYLIGRGWELIPYTPTRMNNLVKSVMEGFKAAYTQDDLLKDLNHAGMSAVQSKIDSQNVIPNIGKALEVDLRNNPGKWEAYARKFGLGHGIDAVKLWYDASGRALWTFSDALMASRVRELELNGMSRTEAIDHARVHMPDYRLPIEILGSRKLVRAMSDPQFSIFGRYHMGMLNSLSTMMTHSLGPNATMAERKEALGNVFALTVMGLVVKPALDLAVQKLTGNKDAETHPRGPLAPLTNAYEVAAGKKDVGMALSNIFTQAPGIRLLGDALSNRDFAGRRIVEPGSPWYKKLGQVTEHAAGAFVSPYGTFGPTVQPGSSKGAPLHEFLSQVTDTKVPTQQQVRGAAYGEKKSKQDAKTRAKHPRGLIEYGLERVTPR